MHHYPSAVSLADSMYVERLLELLLHGFLTVSKGDMTRSPFLVTHTRCLEVILPRRIVIQPTGYFITDSEMVFPKPCVLLIQFYNVFSIDVSLPSLPT